MPFVRRKVYVVQDQYRLNNGVRQPKFDLSPAEAYGQLVFLLSPDVNVHMPESIIESLHKSLSTYKPTDYILLIGNPCLIGWATAIAASYSGGLVTQLQWEARAREYLVIRSDLKISLLS